MESTRDVSNHDLKPKSSISCEQNEVKQESSAENAPAPSGLTTLDVARAEAPTSVQSKQESSASSHPVDPVKQDTAGTRSPPSQRLSVAAKDAQTLEGTIQAGSVPREDSKPSVKQEVPADSKKTQASGTFAAESRKEVTKLAQPDKVGGPMDIPQPNKTLSRGPNNNRGAVQSEVSSTIVSSSPTMQDTVSKAPQQPSVARPRRDSPKLQPVPATATTGGAIALKRVLSGGATQTNQPQKDARRSDLTVGSLARARTHEDRSGRGHGASRYGPSASNSPSSDRDSRFPPHSRGPPREGPDSRYRPPPPSHSMAQPRHSPLRSRPQLERHASMSSLADRGDRTPPTSGTPALTKARSFVGGTSSREFSPTRTTIAAADGQEKKRSRVDELRRDVSWSREERRGPVASESKSSSPSKSDIAAAASATEIAVKLNEVIRSVPSPIKREKVKEPVATREELPALPAIPFFEPTLLESTSQASPSTTEATDDQSTPTRTSKRPRLGWGQGLVASSPSEPKRPRIGWGEGLVPAKTPTESGGSPSVATLAASDEKAGAARVDEAAAVPKPDDAVAMPADDSTAGEAPQPVSTDGTVCGTLTESGEPGEQSLSALNEDSAVSVDGSVAPIEDPQEEGLDFKLEKESILTSIDGIDSSMSAIKRRMIELQRAIEESETGTAEPMETDSEIQDDASAPVEAIASCSVADSDQPMTDDLSRKDTEGSDNEKQSAADPSTSPELPPRAPSLPARTKVDAGFVQLVASIYRENGERAAAANAAIPKRFENGEVATRLYCRPSDYPFYHSNLDRGRELLERVRLSVQARNRRRHEKNRRLARDFLDQRRTWKQRVKRLEKDRKKQDKLRVKQQERLLQNQQKGKNEQGIW
ncbi:hypothetical protein PINS_up012625 [Pythium insidiosum]|nr:hypothetical protein PINS_up012625 [Pythium insidiosum]